MRKRFLIVGMAGFEPAISWSQTRRPSKLGYIPRGSDMPLVHRGQLRPRAGVEPASLRLAQGQGEGHQPAVLILELVPARLGRCT